MIWSVIYVRKNLLFSQKVIIVLGLCNSSYSTVADNMHLQNVLRLINNVINK